MTQLTRDDLTGMTPEQINTARAEGRLDTLLGIAHRPRSDADQLTTADLAHMTPEEINTAREAGRLDVLLGIREPDPPAPTDPAPAPQPAVGFLTPDDLT